MKKVAVVGGAGFIGSNLVDKLLEKNLEVTIIDNLSTGKKENINPKATFHNLDICGDSKDLVTALKGIDVVFHLAALARVQPSITDPVYFDKVNTNGTVNLPGGTDGDCKLDTKPQPQWTNNWLSDALRGQVYQDWSKLHKLKADEPVFEGDYNITSGNLTPRIDVFDNSIPSTELKNVIILANFDVNSQTVNTNFPGGVTTTWYDLMDETGNTTVSNSTTSLTIPAGQFLILGNVASNVLSVDDNGLFSFSIYPNPTNTSFSVNTNVSDIEIYDLTGKLVKFFNGEFTRTDTFDISTLNTGMYIVKVENSNNQTVTTKLVKL